VNLRQAIYQARRSGCELIGVTRHALWLSHAVNVDLGRALGHDWQTAGDGGKLDVALFSDDLLPDWSDSWLAVPRMKFRLLRLDILESIMESSLRVGRRLTAIEIARLIVAAEPSRQSAQALLAEARELVDPT
jgi:hypothetical protein